MRRDRDRRSAAHASQRITVPPAGYLFHVADSHARRLSDAFQLCTVRGETAYLVVAGRGCLGDVQRDHS